MTRYCLIFLIVFSAFGLQTKAQLKPFSFGVYGEGLFRTDDYKETLNNGYGGGLDFSFKLPAKLALIASAGILHFGEKMLSPTTKTPEMNIIPIRAGIKYRFSMIYAKLEGGAAAVMDGGETSVIVSPGLGVKLSILDIQAKYEIWLQDVNQQFAGVKIGIRF